MIASLLVVVFFFNDTATTEIYTLSLHDALPIYRHQAGREPARQRSAARSDLRAGARARRAGAASRVAAPAARLAGTGGIRRRCCHRSEEHTSELQSPCNLVCRLLLEKKKNSRPLPSPCTAASSPMLRHSSGPPERAGR